jgi:uncharacterized protein YraI
LIRHRMARLTLAAALGLAPTMSALAQGGSSSSISGVVVDSGGGAIPGAAVVVKNEAGASFETVTNRRACSQSPR